jgi:hypothetical protein
MSFPVDPILLLTDGELYARTLPESAQGGAAKLVGGATVAVALAAGIASYLEAGPVAPYWKALGAKTGPDFMLAWPIAHGKRRRRSPRRDALAAAVFATYPLWWWLGWDHGRRRRPRA